MKTDLTGAVNALSTGQRAALKRAVGKCLQEADAKTLQVLFSVMPQESKTYEQEIYLAVSSMICLWKPEDRRSPKPFAECASILKRESPTTEHRLIQLLDTPYNYGEGFLITKLSRMARQFCANGLYPDFDRLLTDLFGWNAPDRYVQRKWMSEFMYTEKNNNEKTEE